MKTSICFSIAVLAGLASSSIAKADLNSSVTIDLGGLNSWDAQGDSSNMLFSFGLFGTLLPGGAQVIGVSYDITVSTVGNSWLSEAAIGFSNTDNSAGYSFNPFDGFNFSGTMNTVGAIDLIALGLDFSTNGDALLHMELFESFDDVANAIDANYLAGSFVTIEYKPMPAPGALALLGIGGLIGTRRRLQ